jgi:hypothetical protein
MKVLPTSSIFLSNFNYGDILEEKRNCTRMVQLNYKIYLKGGFDAVGGTVRSSLRNISTHHGCHLRFAGAETYGELV